MATWPASLPQSFRIDGFEESYPDNRLRTQTDQGPPKMRRRTSLNISKMRGSMVLTDSQKADFDAFFDSTLSSGVGQFDFPNPAGGTYQVTIGEELPRLKRLAPDLHELILELDILP